MRLRESTLTNQNDVPTFGQSIDINWKLNARRLLNVEDLKDCDIVIESVAEEIEIKRPLLEKIDGIVGESAIIATNTSSLSVTKLASFVSRPADFVGMHFFNPVPMMSLVEVVRGLRTSEKTYSATRDLAERLGKAPVDARTMPTLAAFSSACRTMGNKPARYSVAGVRMPTM